MSSHSLSLGKRLLFGSTIALLSLALFFGALEAGLRLAGYGHDTRFYRLVRDADGREWVRENPGFTLTYFPPALVRRPQPFRLPVHKPSGSYRIFVLGSSAAMGDPEASFSLSRLLATMLRAAYPEIHFEVVNAAITAINSHVVRDIAADCARLEPDLYIVYEGNNEVIGPFGPAAVLAPFLRSTVLIRASVALRHTRTGQLVDALARRFGGGSDALQHWGGMGMFLEHAIAAADPRLDSVRALFAANLRAIVASGRQAGARTLLCTVVANQRNFAPFLSRHRVGLPADDLRRWNEAFAAGNAAFAAGDARAAEAHYRAAWKLDDQYAELAFRLGRLCLAAGRDGEARDWLQRALDLDALRFRTDSTLNEVIRETARPLSDSAELVDLARALAENSPHGIPGDEMLYEHVHLTFQGTWQAAKVLFASVSSDLVRRKLIETPATQPLTYDQARERLGYTVYEQAMIIDELLDRFQAPPFTKQSDAEVRLATWRQRAATAARLLEQPESRAALEALYERALSQAPGDWVLARNYGMALVALGEPARAVPWLEKARSTIDDDPDLLFALARALRGAGRADEADAVLATLRRIAPHYPGAAPVDAATTTPAGPARDPRD